MKLQVVQDTETMRYSLVERTIAYLDSRSDYGRALEEEIDREISNVAC